MDKIKTVENPDRIKSIGFFISSLKIFIWIFIKIII